ncbi:MAG: DUF4446 family protein [Lapillicoccus sp.]
MTLTSAQLTGLAVVVGLVAVAALALAIGSHLRLSRMRRRFGVLWAGGEADVATLAAGQERRIVALTDQVEALRDDVREVRGDLRQSLRNVAVVRYDAFGDMGGRLSFSCAVVDDEGDGLVISSIHARGESRTYAKGIVGGASEITLSPEEQEALRAARGGPVTSTARTTARTTARERR